MVTPNFPMHSSNYGQPLQAPQQPSQSKSQQQQQQQHHPQQPQEQQQQQHTQLQSQSQSLLTSNDNEREYLDLDDLRAHRFTELRSLSGIDPNKSRHSSANSAARNTDANPGSSSSSVTNSMLLQVGQHHQQRSPFGESGGSYNNSPLERGDGEMLLHQHHVQQQQQQQQQQQHHQQQQQQQQQQQPHQHQYYIPIGQHQMPMGMHQQQTSDESSCMQYNREMATIALQPTASSVDQMSSSAPQLSSLDKSPNMHPPLSSPTTCLGSSRKRKSFYTEGSDFDDDISDESKSMRNTDDNKKQNHSEIEKRRRDKMNLYITELSAMIPMCSSMSRKLDKLTVLRMAVQHLKSIRGTANAYTEGQYKPAFLSERELKMLILQAADGFLFVVGCDRGRILYVSESVAQVLNYSQAELLGQSWFDVVHPKDVPKVKEQLSASDMSPREKLIDAKTMLPVRTDEPHGLSRLCPGARRSFFCRMKSKPFAASADLHLVKEEHVIDPSASATNTTSCSNNSGGSASNVRKPAACSDKKYSVIHCTGYLKSWAPTKLGMDEPESEAENESSNISCLVAIGRIPPNIHTTEVDTSLAGGCNATATSALLNVRSIQFMSRHTIDGKFLFVDQRATLVLGFLPQELLGTSMYEYYHHDDIAALADSHKTVLQTSYKITTNVYQFRTKDTGFARLQSEWKSFRNPWTKEIEYLMAKNSVIVNETQKAASTLDMQCYRAVDGNQRQLTNNFDFFNQASGRDMQHIINTHLEASKIGQQVADRAMELQRRIDDSSADESTQPHEEMLSITTQQLMSSGDNSASGGERPPARYVLTQQIPAQRSSSHTNLTTLGSSMVDSSAHQESDIEIARFMANNSGSSTTDPDTFSGGTAGTSSATASLAPSMSGDGNDEAAMAVIMSLLEADAGLGGPVDYAGLPWQLPKAYF